MKKSITFLGVGTLFAAMILFLLRLINMPFFTDKLNITLVLAGISLVVLVIGLIKKMNVPLMFAAIGGFIVAILGFLIRFAGLEDNTWGFFILLVLGLVTLVVGLIKGK